LLPGTRALVELGNEVVLPYPPDTAFQLVLDTLICRLPNNGLVLTAQAGYNDYEWNDGSTGQSINVTSAGKYWVVCKDDCHSRMDTFILSGLDFIRPEITVKERELGTTLPYVTYQWLINGNVIPGATSSTYNVSENGEYQVIVSNENGCKDTSNVYTVTDAGGSYIDDHPLTKAIHIYPNPTYDIIHIHSPVVVNVTVSSIEGKVVTGFSDVRQISLKGLANGMYLLKITDEKGKFIRMEKVIKY
jgi:hypothetical protein